jgi:hypothetical protein
VGEIETGTPDVVYDLLLLAQQALEDCVRYRRFAEDARAAGDGELADWLDELGDSDQEIAERAKSMLKARL